MRTAFIRRTGPLAVLLMFGMSATAWSQSSTEPFEQGSFLALQQAIELALKHHPVVQEANANLKASEARTQQTRSMYYPQIFANADTVAGAGRTNPRFLVGGALLQENQTIFTGGVVANQRLYDFGFTSNLVDSAKLAERAQGQDVNARRALVIVQVQRAYLISLKRQRLVRISEERVRERGIITGQIEILHRQQLKSKLDLDLMRVELVNAESSLIRSRNDLKSSFADLNRAMGVAGREDYVLEDLAVTVTPPKPLESLVSDSLSHPEIQRLKEQTASAEAKLVATKRQYLPTINAIGSGGAFEPFDPRQNQQTGGWWMAGALISMPLFTGFLIENQVVEATAQKEAAAAASMNIEQALTQQVTNSYLDTMTFSQQIKLGEELVKTAQEAQQLSKQRYKLGLGSIVEVTQAEVALTAAQTRLAESQYDYKIAEVTLAYASGGSAQLQIDPTVR
ncbi:putative Outer membrane protein TolC [Nitrospira japonica]|uniref:Putative Outer membrane protein TolC n=1 Tax=Nitrospira japonica TaxID=1325564 RepID=A0A1W1I9G2_9BACT|nr:TolC family protein [Nitrospira japonica]SLM49677.1 putative Outer membrane protein TolC [Nitrospira japonica]